MIAHEGIRLRPWRAGDEETLVELADDRGIWENMRDIFPHPYVRADAERWIAVHLGWEGPPRHFAIEEEGRLAGGVGFDPLPDVHRVGAEIGYWIGRPFWGRGIATRALTACARYAFERFPFERLQATVFSWNPASARVLEKCGFKLEGVLRRSVVKGDRVGDSLVYARLRGEW
jgi:RimJ/RimL family protein N-acetyltransferase